MKKSEKIMKKVEMRAEVFLCLSPRERLLLGKYESPESEKSHFKGIPMELYKTAMSLLPSRKRRIKFTAKGKTVCKEFAETFSIFYWPSFYLWLGSSGEWMFPRSFAEEEFSYECRMEALELASKKRRTILAGGEW
jgi:hypothetical protein